MCNNLFDEQVLGWLAGVVTTACYRDISSRCGVGSWAGMRLGHVASLRKYTFNSRFH